MDDGAYTSLVKLLLRPYFIIFSTLYLIVRLTRAYFPEFLPDFIAFYLGDFLCMPLVLTFILAILRHIYKPPLLLLNPLMIFGLTTAYSIYFEWYLPKQSPLLFTADKIDVLMYFIGATLFYFIQKTKYFKTHIY